MTAYCHLSKPQIRCYEQVVRAMQRDLESTDDRTRARCRPAFPAALETGV